MKRFFVFIIILTILGYGLYVFRLPLKYRFTEWQKQDLPEPVKVAEIYEDSPKEPSKQSRKKSGLSVNLDIPFSPQAPFANWDLPYQEACEEASVLLVHSFFQNETLTPEKADREILRIVEWEKKKFGFYQHTTAEKTAEILRGMFGYKKVAVKYDITIEDIKKEVGAGRPVILPFAGRLLGNPYYRQPGPVYHMLVVKGYTENGKFITNDVGTKRGKDFLYDQNVLWNAIRDVPENGDSWAVEKPEEFILTGRKAMVVAWPNGDISDAAERP